MVLNTYLAPPKVVQILTSIFNKNSLTSNLSFTVPSEAFTTVLSTEIFIKLIPRHIELNFHHPDSILRINVLQLHSFICSNIITFEEDL